MEITQDKVKELFEYRDGALFWQNRTVNSLGRCNKYLNGKPAGTYDSHGYLQTKINGKLYRNHRLIFLMFYGYMPKILDHINGVREDNRIENLRPATISQNNHNMRLRKDNTSSVKNVCFNKTSNVWQVRIMINNKNKSFGNYEDLELAELVAIEARSKLHKEYANHGKH
jgi:hypothetical protein